MVDPVTPPAVALEGRRWLLTELEGQTVAPIDGESAPHLVFVAEESRLSGSGGCNRLMGRFELSGGSLRLGPVATTKMVCAEVVMRREEAFLGALGTVTRYELEGQVLVLLGGDLVVARLAAANLEPDS